MVSGPRSLPWPLVPGLLRRGLPLILSVVLSGGRGGVPLDRTRVHPLARTGWGYPSLPGQDSIGVPLPPILWPGQSTAWAVRLLRSRARTFLFYSVYHIAHV